MRLDGSAYTRVTNNPDHDAHPAWSGSSRLIFVRQVPFVDDLDLFGINPNGSGEAPVSPGQLVDVWLETQPAVSPDGSWIAFQSRGEIWVMNATGNGRVNLTNHGAFDAGPSWSPDGTRIAFSSDHDGDEEIWIMNADGTNPIQVTHNDVAADFDPNWSPDGRKIAFISERTGHSDIYVMKRDGTALKQVTATPQVESAPAWSR